MSDEQEAEAPTKLHVNAISTTSAVATLGLIAATSLRSNGIVTLMVGADGHIELVPAGELELDGLDEGAALNILVLRNYTDEQMHSYLEQRNQRKPR